MVAMASMRIGNSRVAGHAWAMRIVLGASERVVAGDGRASIGGVIASAYVMGRVDGGRSTGANHARLGILGVRRLDLGPALPEAAAAAAGVVVLGRGAEPLLALVVAAEAQLDEGGDQEEEAGANGVLALFVEEWEHGKAKKKKHGTGNMWEMRIKTYAPMIDTANAALFKRQARP